ncbi:MAG: hypothetical protein U0I51_02610, partial [Muricomes sp.]|nr:hypothetical protein [Muricomes sp.]
LYSWSYLRWVRDIESSSLFSFIIHEFLENKVSTLFIQHQFMEMQKRKYTCPKCGGIISIHDRECSECQESMKVENTVVDELKRNL